MQNGVSLFDFYFNKSKKTLNKYSINRQISIIGNFKTLILDYCGISYKYTKSFNKNTKIFLMDSDREKMEKLTNIEEYQIVLVYKFKTQQIPEIKNVILCLLQPNVYDFLKPKTINYSKKYV
ncbi:hypothetical protein EHP00_13 [Ecytonucleospora hepatopenaei]|uniref:Uncharacterized protein n=1 Tax=Ecytonucleospora hepatopenaei TaxID=646526 RepID=A0A1W0E5H5_9MICR|nr:hypothetical protein EHP00_13 [Ecytonucleospora hepatopenaei]